MNGLEPDIYRNTTLSVVNPKFTHLGPNFLLSTPETCAFVSPNWQQKFHDEMIPKTGKN
jgi:hypothetical protein